MSRSSNRVRNRATASGARTDAPPVLTSKWTAGNVKSDKGPHSSYRIRGSQCASSIGGGEKSKADEVLCDDVTSLLSESGHLRVLLNFRTQRHVFFVESGLKE